jgi:POT family proton-dependent oligopeptide transporter
MNLYAGFKTDRMLLGMQVPTVSFRVLNAGILFLYVNCGIVLGKRKPKGKRSSSTFKMANWYYHHGFGSMVLQQWNFEK